jgi:hypothetical protein
LSQPIAAPRLGAGTYIGLFITASSVMSVIIMVLQYGYRRCGAISQCQRALLLKQQKAPGELDDAAADPGVAGSGEPFFAPLCAAPLSSGAPVGPAQRATARAFADLWLAS